MELSWFRKPSADDPGTLNLCYDALDLHVVRGRATQPALRSGTLVDFATLLERAASLAGTLRSLGVEQGTRVGSALGPEPDGVLAMLACVRLGAVYVDAPVADDLHLVIEPEAVQPAVKAGRSEPAACVELAPDTTAYVVAGRSVAHVDALDDPSWLGRACATLCAGGVLELATDPAGDRG